MSRTPESEFVVTCARGINVGTCKKGQTEFYPCWIEFDAMDDACFLRLGDRFGSDALMQIK